MKDNLERLAQLGIEAVDGILRSVRTVASPL